MSATWDDDRPKPDLRIGPGARVLATLRATSDAFVMIRVGCLAGLTLPSSSFAVSPDMHMSTATGWTPGNSLTALTSGVPHDDACSGCSWTKYLPAATWILYISMHTLKCATASRTSFSTRLGSIFALLRFLRLLNIVQGGDPMKTKGW